VERSQPPSQWARQAREILELPHSPGAGELFAVSLAHESAKRVGFGSGERE